MQPASIDYAIRGYIEQLDRNNYESIFATDDHFDVFYHLSDLRLGVFAWYDFLPKAHLLEIGAGFGALTGFFCGKCEKVSVVEESLYRAESIYERYKDLDNLSIYAGSVQQIPFQEKFDYIVYNQTSLDAMTEENSVSILKYLSTLLTSNGVLLIIADNRYGLKYMCGEKNYGSSLPFSGINKMNSGSLLHSKAELEQIVSKAGFLKKKFYYPLPDAHFPQLIYTDDYLPVNNVNERMIPYYLDAGTLVADERMIYKDLIENNVFPFFSNSYLIECSCSSKNLCRAIYAVMSLDRGRDRAFATIITENNKVIKKAVFAEGIDHAKAVYRNAIQLQNHNVPMVQHTFFKDYIEMPYIKAPLLTEWLRNNGADESKLFLKIVDEIYDIILESAEHVAADSNVLLSKNPQADWGVILKYAYIELMSLNCFYVDGKLLFFDQEYVKNNYPAKYILFRALYYFYGFYPEIEKNIPLEYFKEKYILNDLWDVFIEEENKFQFEVRKQTVYASFLKWGKIQPRQIQRNMFFLERSNKIQEEYLFDAAEGKIIVVFGAGAYFKAYMEQYGEKYTPVFIVDNNQTKWGTYRDCIEIKSPDALFNFRKENLHIVICSAHYQSIEEQLSTMNFDKYKIYI